MFNINLVRSLVLAVLPQADISTFNVRDLTYLDVRVVRDGTQYGARVCIGDHYASLSESDAAYEICHIIAGAIIQRASDLHNNYVKGTDEESRPRKD